MTRLVVAAVLSLTFMGSPASAQQTPSVPAPIPAAASLGGMKVAFINLQQVAGESAEGKIANAKVQALNQKKVNELSDKNKQVQTDQQKLQQGGAVLNDATRAQLEKEVEKLNLEIERFQQDATSEVNELQQQLQGEFQQKHREPREGPGDQRAVQHYRRRGHFRRPGDGHHHRGHQTLRCGLGRLGLTAGCGGAWDRQTGCAGSGRARQAVRTGCADVEAAAEVTITI